MSLLSLCHNQIQMRTVVAAEYTITSNPEATNLTPANGMLVLVFPLTHYLSRFIAVWRGPTHPLNFMKIAFFGARERVNSEHIRTHEHRPSEHIVRSWLDAI